MAGATVKGKKRWVQIIGPAFFNNALLGESYVSEPSLLIGKTVYAHLSYLTGDMRKQYTVLGFKVTSVKGSDAYADLISYSLVLAHVKRMVRPNKDKIDDSFTVETKDHLALRIKPVILTRNKAHNSLLTKIRKHVRDSFIALSRNHSFPELVDGLISGHISKELKQQINKIYPINTFEVRSLELIRR